MTTSTVECNMKSYKQYVVNEGLIRAYTTYFEETFNIKYTDYGTDYKNKQWVKKGNTLTTYFLSGKTIFKVDLISDGDMYHVKFSHKKENEEEFGYKMLYDLTSSLSLFNRIMYVVSEGVAKYNINKVAFGNHPSNQKLDAIYDKMVSNKTFIRTMDEYEFDYKGKKEDLHIFQKD